MGRWTYKTYEFVYKSDYPASPPKTHVAQTKYANARKR